MKELSLFEIGHILKKGCNSRALIWIMENYELSLPEADEILNYIFGNFAIDENALELYCYGTEKYLPGRYKWNEKVEEYERI